MKENRRLSTCNRLDLSLYFGNRRLFHDFETIQGLGFQKEQEKHKNIFNVT